MLDFKAHQAIDPSSEVGREEKARASTLTGQAATNCPQMQRKGSTHTVYSHCSLQKLVCSLQMKACSLTQVASHRALPHGQQGRHVSIQQAVAHRILPPEGGTQPPAKQMHKTTIKIQVMVNGGPQGSRTRPTNDSGHVITSAQDD